jgi:hypothetical protein
MSFRNRSTFKLSMGYLTGRSGRTALASRAIRIAADDFARRTLPMIEEVRSSGIASLKGIARALNDRGVATARGGRWTVDAVARVLARDAAAARRGSRQAATRGARRGEREARDRAALKALEELRGQGIVTVTGIARELTARRVPTTIKLGARWYPATVRALLARHLAPALVPPKVAMPSRTAKAQRDAEICRLLRQLVGDGWGTAKALAEELNRRGIPTMRGAVWTNARVILLLERADPITRALLHSTVSQAKGRNLQPYREAQYAAAKRYVETLRPQVERLIAEGFDTVVKLRDELNRIGAVGLFGGPWSTNSLGMYLRSHWPKIYETVLTRSSASRFERIRRALDGITRRGAIGATEIAARLNERGIPTISGKAPWNGQSAARLLKRLGRYHLLKKPPFWTAERIAFAVAMREEGKSTADIAWEFSVSVATIGRVLRQARQQAAPPAMPVRRGRKCSGG